LLMGVLLVNNSNRKIKIIFLYRNNYLF
jgi:hypothetical protein